MYKYLDLVREIGISDVAVALITGDIQPLDRSQRAPFISNGFPPALLPIWSCSHEYTGFWKHWFVDRRTSIVHLTMEERVYAEERAFNIEQLAIICLIQGICAGGKESKWREFAARLHLAPADISEALRIADDRGDDDFGIADHPRFARNCPLALCDRVEQYAGEFPTSLSDSAAVWRTCSIEMSNEALEHAVLLADCPPWIRAAVDEREQRPIFDQALRNGRLGEAWLTLNSAGWDAFEAKEALRDLAAVANDPAFSTLVAAWSSARQYGY